MIASLKIGITYCQLLTASLQQVQVLLASSQAGVVHDAIVFLTTCRWVGLTGLGWPWSVPH